MNNIIKNIDINHELRDYQKRYYDKLITGNQFHSLVCIPTGGGKTRLAVVYLIMNAINTNKKILWVTHSQFLLNQAYDTFWSYMGTDWMNENAILIHSGENDKTVVKKVKDIAGEHRLVICSFQSLQKTSADWKNVLGDNVVIVIDEAHHIVAPSYIGLLDNYMENKTAIGLTATPIRMKRAENNALYGIFRDNLGVRIHMTELFEKGHLVRPLFEIVNYSTEKLEQSNINSIDDLDQYLVENSDDYNQRIIEKYVQNEDKYGKTVIFAINKMHADSLYELFCKKYGNERVFIVYSDLRKNEVLEDLPIGANRETQFTAFKESRNGILININVLNEGVDIPDIQTIFMTKPLNSRTTVTQIIGRALRTSPKTNKKCAYIVNFAVSNLGRKLLMVMPKTVYNQYAAEWESEEMADEYEENEERVSELGKMVEKVKKKAGVCSFSDICLAGNYTIIGKNEKDEIPVPVSYKEYRKIEHFRKGLLYSKTYPFPKRLFFCESDSILVQNAFRENDLYDISFKAYDTEFLTEIELLLNEVTEKIKVFLLDGVKRSEYEAYFISKYTELKDKENATVLWYLDQIGIRNEKDFVYFMRQELPIIKQQIKEDSN